MPRESTAAPDAGLPRRGRGLGLPDRRHARRRAGGAPPGAGALGAGHVGLPGRRAAGSSACPRRAAWPPTAPGPAPGRAEGGAGQRSPGRAARRPGAARPRSPDRRRGPPPRRAHAVTERTAEADRSDPAAWLDVEDVRSDRHGLARRAARAAAPRRPRSRAFDARSRIKGVPQAAPELAEVLAALSRREPAGRIPSARLLSPAGLSWRRQRSTTLRWALRGWRRPALAGGREVARSASGSCGSSASRRHGAAAAAAAVRLGQRLSAGFHRLAARLTVASRLSLLSRPPPRRLHPAG